MSLGIDRKEFITILSCARNYLLSVKHKLKKIKTGEEFEAILFSVIQEICAERKIRDVRRTGKQTFPDILIWPYGIEAKSTISDSWASTGNSIVETTRVEGIKEIYMFFLRQGKNEPSDIRFKPYDKCLSDIVVTHSPRYKINMDLGPDDTIFKKMGIDYKTFIQSDSIKKAKEYYRSILKEGEELWWIDQQDDAGIIPIIKNFGDLDKGTQEKFKIESMILFPEIFSSSNRKYIKVTLHLLQKYQATCSSLRDLFSAGGQRIIRVRGKREKVPKIYFNLYLNAKNIETKLGILDIDELSRMWNVTIPKKSSAKSIWTRLLDKNSELAKPKASDIYKEGLRIS